MGAAWVLPPENAATMPRAVRGCECLPGRGAVHWSRRDPALLKIRRSTFLEAIFGFRSPRSCAVGSSIGVVRTEGSTVVASVAMRRPTEDRTRLVNALELDVRAPRCDEKRPTLRGFKETIK